VVLQLAEGEGSGICACFRDVPHSVPRIQLALHCQRFLDDPVLLWSPYVIRSNASIDAFVHFMKIFNGFEPQFSPEIVNDLMLLVREFGYDRLTASLAPQRDAPRRQEHAHGLLQELGKHVRGATFKVDLRFLRDSFSRI
jgi:hypothetical protein